MPNKKLTTSVDKLPVIKASVRLIASMVVPVLLLVYIEAYNPIYLLRDHYTKQFFLDNYGGTFHLIENKLKQTPTLSWPVTFKKIQEDFTYDLQLLPVSEASQFLELENEVLSGEFVYVEQEPPLLLHRIADTRFFIKMNLDDTDGERSINAAAGTIALLDERFEHVEQNKYSEVLDLVQVEFGIGLELTSIHQLSLPSGKLEQLHNKQIVSHFDKDGEESIYFRVQDSEAILKAKLPTLGKINFILVTTGVSLMLLASFIGLLFWLWPLSRDLKQLDRVSRDFGIGELDGRVNIKSGSIAARLGHSFNDMADSIQKLIRSNQSITNAVAHDLRTPLARLRFAFEILESEEYRPEEKAKYTSSIHASIDSLDYLINQTLLHARYSRVATREHFKLCKYSDAMADEVEQFAFTHETLQFDLNIAEELKSSEQYVDKRALNRALSNLLSNAARYAKSRIDIGFDIKTVSDVDCLVITVSDDGVGIEVEKRASIFEAFAQIDNQERDSNSGHGLGLAIVSQIAAWHKGVVSAGESNLGGAKFSLSWPVSMPHSD